MSELRLYAIVNMEAMKLAGGNRGKMMAQAGHAFLHAWWDAASLQRHFYGGETRAKAYRDSNSAAKIVLAAENEAELRGYYDDIFPNRLGIGVTLVTDAARTVFPEPTVTFLGLGPLTKEEAPEWLQKLKVLI